MESSWNEDKVTKCKNCHTIIENPRVRVIKKGSRKGEEIRQEFCNDKCRSTYYNIGRGKMKRFIEEIQDLLKRQGTWGKVSIAFELIVKKYHFD